jgi:hypothetical protein
MANDPVPVAWTALRGAEHGWLITAQVPDGPPVT